MKSLSIIPLFLLLMAGCSKHDPTPACHIRERFGSSSVGEFTLDSNGKCAFKAEGLKFPDNEPPPCGWWCFAENATDISRHEIKQVSSTPTSCTLKINGQQGDVIYYVVRPLQCDTH